MCCALQLGSGFVQTFPQFLAVRSLFGVAMGGVWGLAASTALENIPVEARGLASGVVQQGYAVGYLFAAVINLRLVPNVPQNWRSLFWTAAGVSFFAACVRAVTPESEIFLRAQRLERERGGPPKNKTKIFLHETKEMLKLHWLLCIYALLLMTGMFLYFFDVHGVPIYPILSIRLQFSFPWITRPLSDLPGSDEGFHTKRCNDSYHHRKLRESRILIKLMKTAHRLMTSAY